MRYLLGAILLAATFTTNATVIDFNNPATPNCGCGVGDYDESGVEFFGRFGHNSYNLSPHLTPHLSFGYGTFMQVTTADDSLFDLLSVDLGEYSQNFAGNQYEITVVGRKADDTLVTQVFQLDGVMSGPGDWDTGLETFLFSADFTGLKAAYFENTSSFYRQYHPLLEGNYGYPDEFNLNPFAMDNLAMSVVPVPPAVWLFGSALAGLGWLRRS